MFVQLSETATICLYTLLQMSDQEEDTRISKQLVGQGSGLTPWKPGQSGNPTGRPKGIARILADSGATRQEVAAKLWQAALNEWGNFPPNERMKALLRVADHVLGKPVETMAVVDATSAALEPFLALAPDDLKALARAAREARALPAVVDAEIEEG